MWPSRSTPGAERMTICSSIVYATHAWLHPFHCYTLPFQGMYAKAEPLYERCQAIQEKILGSEHERVASTINERASLLEAQVTVEPCCFRRVLKSL